MTDYKKRIEEILGQHKHDITTAYASGKLELEIQQLDKLAEFDIEALLHQVEAESRFDELDKLYVELINWYSFSSRAVKLVDERLAAHREES